MAVLPSAASPGGMAWSLNGSGSGRDRPCALAVYSDRTPEADRRALAMLRSTEVLPGLVEYATKAPPLAAGVLASLASAIEPLMGGLGALVAALPRLERELVSLAWVDSVTGLRRLGAGFALHAVSVVPGTSFAVSLTPEPIVRRLTRRDVGIPVAVPAGAIEVVVAGRETNPAWVSDFVEPTFAGRPIVDVAATAAGPAWWSTRRVVEVVAYPTDVESLAERVGSDLRRSECAWCGEEIASTVCPFCRRPRRSRRRGAGAPA